MTLVEELKNAEKIRSFIEVTDVHRTIFSDWKRKNDLVNDVVNGKERFIDVYDAVMDTYTMADFLYNPGIGPQIAQELAEVVGNLGVGDKEYAESNRLPFIAGIGLSAMFILAETLNQSRRHEGISISRRELLISAAVGIGTASIVGLGTMKNRYSIASEAEQNALYADNRVKLIFR